MQNKNTTIIIVLLVVIAAILAFVAFKKPETEVVETPSINNSSGQQSSTNTVSPQQQSGGQAFQFCPDEKIVNQQGQTGSTYYIHNGTRYEISQFDTVWVSAHCNVPEQKVY